MPPHLGQGMCSGIRDATNLAWKLARVVRGRSPISLLDTYETERSPHVETYVVVAAEMANQIENMEAPAARGDDDHHEVVKMEADALRPRLGPGVRAGGTDDFAGTLSAQPKLADGQALDDAVGYRFAIVAEPCCLADTSAATKALLQLLEIAVIDASGEAADWIAGLNVSAVLIRPDRYIFGSAHNAAEVDALVSKLDAALMASVLTTLRW
jgi:3-(3-hydroxy-phenyl)propionate hydroxylase